MLLREILIVIGAVGAFAILLCNTSEPIKRSHVEYIAPECIAYTDMKRMYPDMRSESKIKMFMEVLEGCS